MSEPDEMRSLRWTHRDAAGGTRKTSAFEELVSGAARRLLLRARRFESFDFAREQCDTLAELLYRQQREILPNLVDKFLFRPFLVLVRRHSCIPFR
jgi:hypothetical protein